MILTVVCSAPLRYSHQYPLKLHSVPFSPNFAIMFTPSFPIESGLCGQPVLGLGLLWCMVSPPACHHWRRVSPSPSSYQMLTASQLERLHVHHSSLLGFSLPDLGHSLCEFLPLLHCCVQKAISLKLSTPSGF